MRLNQGFESVRNINRKPEKKPGIICFEPKRKCKRFFKSFGKFRLSLGFRLIILEHETSLLTNLNLVYKFV